MGKTGCVQTLVCWDTNWSLRNVLLLEECALKNSDGTVRDCLLGKCEALASVPSIVGRRGTKQRGRMESILQVKV